MSDATQQSTQGTIYTPAVIRKLLSSDDYDVHFLPGANVTLNEENVYINANAKDKTNDDDSSADDDSGNDDNGEKKDDGNPDDPTFPAAKIKNDAKSVSPDKPMSDIDGGTPTTTYLSFMTLSPDFINIAKPAICVIKAALMFIAGILSLYCNQAESMVMRVVSFIFSILLSDIYIIYYAVYHLFLGNACPVPSA